MYLTPASYDELVIKLPKPKDEKEKGGKEKLSNRWLVECYASWSPPCVHLEPLFAQLSVQYGGDHLQVHTQPTLVSLVRCWRRRQLVPGWVG